MSKARFKLDNILNPEIKKQVEAQLKSSELNLPQPKKQNKFGAIKVEYNGDIYDSTKEGEYAKKLDVLKNAPDLNQRVLKYERQLRYDIILNGIKCGFYKLDFKVWYADGSIRYYDIKGYKKGMAYQHFRFKKKIIQALFDIIIEEE